MIPAVFPVAIADREGAPDTALFVGAGPRDEPEAMSRAVGLGRSIRHGRGCDR